MLQGVDFTNFSTGPEPGWTDKRGRPPRGQDRGRGRPRDTLLATRFLRYDLQLQLLRPAQHGKRAAHSHVGVGEQAMQIIHAGNRLPSRATITSPSRNPARWAGLPGVTADTITPLSWRR